MESINTPDSQPTHPENNSSVLDPHQRNVIRQSLVDAARKLLGIPYEYGAEWHPFSILPKSIDCSELVEGVYVLNGLKMPDGGQQQFDFTVPTGNPLPGDLAFFARGGNVKQIYHVGMLFDISSGLIIEARGLQPESTFETGKVILRARSAWENYKNFVGYRAHPKLI
jgi:cell wall-associated NlpC family hydrolase